MPTVRPLGTVGTSLRSSRPRVGWGLTNEPGALGRVGGRASARPPSLRHGCCIIPTGGGDRAPEGRRRCGTDRPLEWTEWDAAGPSPFPPADSPGRPGRGVGEGVSIVPGAGAWLPNKGPAPPPRPALPRPAQGGPRQGESRGPRPGREAGEAGRFRVGPGGGEGALTQTWGEGAQAPPRTPPPASRRPLPRPSPSRTYPARGAAPGPGGLSGPRPPATAAAAAAPEPHVRRSVLASPRGPGPGAGGSGRPPASPPHRAAMAPSPPFSSRRRLLLLLTSPRPRAVRAPSARPSPRPPLQPASPGRGVRREPRARARAATGGWMDGAGESASVRARAPLPLPPRGLEARRERAPTSSSSSSRPSFTPRPRPPFLFLLSLSRAQRWLAPATRARARASAPRPQLGSICSRGRRPSGEEGRHAAGQSTGGWGRGRGRGRGLLESPRPIVASPWPGRPNRLAVSGAAFKVRCAVRWGRNLVPSRPAPGRGQRVASKESAGSRPSLGRLPARASPPFPRGSRLAPRLDAPLNPAFTLERAATYVKRPELKWGAISTSGQTAPWS